MRTVGDPESMRKALREAIWSVDPDQPVWKIRTINALVLRDLAPTKLSVKLIGAFLGVLFLLCGLGWLTFLWPPLGSQVFVGVALFAITTTFINSGWLFIRGVDDVKWRESAALAATSIWR